MFLLIAICLVAQALPILATSCERAPSHAQPADTFYKLGLAGDPDLFLPGELYTVSLKGIDNGQGPTPFIGFLIWAELEEAENETDNKTDSSKEALGSFQAYDAQAKPYEFCKPAVCNTTSHPKTEIQVTWTAPSGAIESCVRICVRATQVNNDLTPTVLAQKLCPAPAATLSRPRQPPIIEPCCACDEAKYEVTFDGMWSRNTHSREFPPESARAHFGDVIGASHTAQYRVWQEGRIASLGLRRLADDGTTTALEKELKAESEHIRTIIKARGISWQQVAGAGMPSTFAVFRADAKHHLMSLAAKIAPSPDWIVGVSALELCNANCTWRQSAILPLYPYDAGTDSGISYVSRRQPTIPQTPVRALRPGWPKDARSPFYSSTGDMRPIARIRLNRLRLYEKSCDAIESGIETVVEGSGMSGGSCAVHTWGAWSPCSVSCGEGRASRQRHYVWPLRARTESCRLQLTDYKQCHGPRMHCRVQSEYEKDPAESTGPCAVSAWSEWSACGGCGIRARTRHYLVPRAQKRCSRGYRGRTIMSQAMPCEAGPCYKPPPQYVNATNFDWFYIDNPHGTCATSPWSDWSPCAARCGRGRRLRTRVLLTTVPHAQYVLTQHLLAGWNKLYAQLQELKVPDVNVTSEDPEIEAVVQKHLERCQFTLTQQEAMCDGDDPDCINETLSNDDCTSPKSVGHCRGYEERWFFDVERRTCEPFGFSGCGGNGNNYRTNDACITACASRDIHQATTQPPEPVTKRIKPTPSNADNEVMQNDSPVEDINCETGPWLGWSECFGNCDIAVKLNYRLILRHPSGEGQLCQKVIKSRPCKPAQCKNRFPNNSSDTYHTTEHDD